MKIYVRDIDWIIMSEWLHQYIGPSTPNKIPFLGDLVVQGAGWCAHRLVNIGTYTTKDIPLISSWRIEITDDKKGTIFALRWGS
jgi:hypothetical protein